MSEINQAYFDRVRYTIQNKNISSVIIPEPIGWDFDDKEYDRDEKHHGIFVKLSNNLKFIGDGYDTLKYIYEVHGINEEVRLIREEKHPKTDEWTRTYDGYLDMSTYKEEKKQISLKFNSGGLESTIKARSNENVELTRSTSLDGKELNELSVNEVEIEGRRIFLVSKWEKDNSVPLVTLDVQSDAGNTRRQTKGFPLKLYEQSHEEAQSVIFGSEGHESNGSTGMMFFANSEEAQTIEIKGEHLKFRPVITASDFQWAIISVCLTIYENGINFDKKSREYLFTTDENQGGSGVIANNNILRELNFSRTINLLPNESVALEFFIEADLASGNNKHFRVDFTDLDGKLIVEEDSFFEKTISKVLLPHEVAERLVEIYTGQKALYSETLGRTDIDYSEDGKASLIGLMHGFWIRQFNEDDEVFKPFTTSINDFMESYGAVMNLGLGIEKIGYRDRVRMEDLSYFYNRNTTIKLPYPVKKVKRSVSTKHFFSSVDVGYEKGGDYEEAFGLDEYNGKSTFTTIFTRYSSLFSKLSKYRADSYGLEFCRRKNKNRYATEDTRYDSHNFMLDMKRGITSIFNIRKWQDDFEIEPTGTFSPETAYNLRLSPLNCLMRHGWEISAGLTKNPTEYLRYASSTGNSSLKTKLVGKPEYAENGNIINSELTRAKYLPEIVEFEHEVTFDISQKLQGTSNILGKEIPNMYGCIEFENENGEIEKGFLLNLKPNKQGKWKLLKAY